MFCLGVEFCSGDGGREINYLSLMFSEADVESECVRHLAFSYAFRRYYVVLAIPICIALNKLSCNFRIALMLVGNIIIMFPPQLYFFEKWIFASQCKNY